MCERGSCLSEWLSFIPAVALAVALVFVPGFSFALALRIAYPHALLLGPLFSVGLVSVGAIVLDVVHLGWNVGNYAVFLAIVVVAVVILRWLIPRSSGNSQPMIFRSAGQARALIAGLVGASLGAAVITTQLAFILGNPDAISQSYDNIFHLNAVRQIAETGSGSSLTLNRIVSGADGLSFYPGAWHDLVSLVFISTGATVPGATNAVTFAVCAIAWPLSMVELARIIRPQSVLFTFATGAFSGVVVGFPTLMLKWGILYPNLLGYAVLPAATALVLCGMRVVAREELRGLLSLVVPVVLAGISLCLAHPNSVTSLAVLIGPVTLASAWNVLRQRQDHLRARLCAFTTVVVAILGIWVLVRPPASASVWPPKLPSGQASGEFITNSFNGNIADLVITLLVCTGAVLSARNPRLRWLTATWLITGVLWVVSASLSPGLLRSALTGSWYNDSFRLAALTSVPVVLLASAGASFLAQKAARWVRGRMPRLSDRSSRRLVFVGVTLVAICVAVGPTMRGTVAATAREFQVTKDSLLLTVDETRVLDKLAEVVAPDEMIAVNPWDGSSLAYGLEDRHVTQYHTLSATPDAYKPVSLRLREAATDPTVCRAVRDNHIRWYLDFDDTLHIGEWAEGQFAGFRGVEAADVVRPVVTSGGVGLYEIVGCGLW